MNPIKQIFLNLFNIINYPLLIFISLRNSIIIQKNLQMEYDDYLKNIEFTEAFLGKKE